MMRVYNCIFSQVVQDWSSARSVACVALNGNRTLIIPRNIACSFDLLFYYPCCCRCNHRKLWSKVVSPSPFACIIYS